MNICFVALSFRQKGAATSGVGAQVRVLAESLMTLGHTVQVVTLGDSEAITRDEGIEVHQVVSGKLHWYVSKLPLIGGIFASPLRELEYAFAAWRGVRSAQKNCAVDVIEGTETGMLLLTLFWKQSPIVIRLHGEQYTFRKYTPDLGLTLSVRLTRVLQRIALRRAKLLISPSQMHAREIGDELADSRPPIVIVPNSINAQGIHLNGHPRAAKTVLYAGRVEPNKGVATFLGAAAKTLRAIPESRFVFAGDFQSSLSQTQFQELVTAHRLNDSIDLPGALGWSALTDLYKSSTVAVLPSYYETFGLAALEPMAFGTPVIASNRGALPEIVIPEVTGRLVASGDETALAAAMIDLLSNPEKCAQMGKAAIRQAARFDVRNVLRLTEYLYRWCRESSVPDGDSHAFFAPHPDDAVFSCGGTIHSLISQGKSVQVTTVFAGHADRSQPAFSRHLNRKWRIPIGVSQQRRNEEDRNALLALGVTKFAFWDYVEAPERTSSAGALLYATYEEIRGELAEPDRTLIDGLTEKILSSNSWPADTVFYFPLSLGQHVDHQILFAVGHRLLAAGRNVRFYEDYPYAQDYCRNGNESNWLPQMVPVSIERKLDALAPYTSQMHGLGGSLETARKRLRRFSNRFGKNSIERYWTLLPAWIVDQDEPTASANLPLLHEPTPIGAGAFKNFIRTFSWGNLEEMLPVGVGRCADIGCGNGRHKEVIESRGYQWMGIDVDSATDVRGEATALSLANESMAAAVAWQMIEYVADPVAVFAEAARVLEPGGVFCGSVSFLEPVHGLTYFNLSPLILEKLLREHGFADVEVKSGLNGFTLVAWTFLRRTSIPYSERLALPLTFLMLAPLAALLFVMSWLGLRLGFGSAHHMRWISETAPLEFAGHLMFSGRKRARD